jgi:bacteriorhodopsin
MPHPVYAIGQLPITSGTLNSCTNHTENIRIFYITIAVTFVLLMYFLCFLLSSELIFHVLN